VRARIDVLSELPAEWEKRLFRWRRMNQRHRARVDGIEVPTPAEESLLYQTRLGAWPFDPSEEQRFVERLQEFLIKAVREAKVRSGWIRQNEPHEKVLLQFAAEILRSGDFREDFLRFQSRIAWHGALNSLSQVLIKITAPGLPDFYQGSELWDLSMVDPDNRRPVDYRTRIQMLEELRGTAGEHPQKRLREYLSHWQDGRIKLYLIDRALDFRGQNADVYFDGEYVPLEASGAKQENVCAFARHKEGHWGLTIATRLTTRLAPARRMPVGKAAWQDTVLHLPASAPQAWKNSLTGDEVLAKAAGGKGRVLLLAEALKRFPVALLGGAS